MGEAYEAAVEIREAINVLREELETLNDTLDMILTELKKMNKGGLE